MDISLSQIKGIGPARLKAFEAAGIRTVRELVMFLPRDYRDLSHTVPLGSIQPGDTVAVHVRHLREKVETDPSDPRYIKVVWGKGYRLEDKT